MVPITNHLLVFRLDEYLYAIPLSAVERVVWATEPMPLPQAPSIVMGLLNLSGRVVPVVNVRSRFRLPEKEIGLTNQMIIAHTKQRMVALVVDSVVDISMYPENDIVASGQILPNLEYIEGVIKLENHFILIHDLDRFLSLDEENQLDDALSNP